MIFLDSSIVKFRLPAQEFDKMVSLVSEYVFSQEALGAASEMFDLLRRMKADGEKVLHEILQNLIEAKSKMHGLLTGSESGQSFADRDAARQQLILAEHNFQRERFLFTALLYDLGTSPQQFFSKNSYPKEISEIIPSAETNTETGGSGSPSENEAGKNEISPWCGVVTVIIIILWLWHPFSR